jgi:DNA helicase IV
LATYKQVAVGVRGRTTYRMEVVKSIEECKIANFLLFNNIDYEYEFPYEYDMPTAAYRAYKPDFTIEQNGRKVHLEHFALDRIGNIPAFFANEGETYQQAKTRYYEKLRWARATHARHGTQLIETYSYEVSEGVLFQNLTQRLEAAGITLCPKSPAEIWRIITEAAQDEVDGFQ